MDAEACYRAIEGRDGRFAGRFFLGVRTTRIYCRPGCPARVPRRENIVLFPSAAAAQQAGFRACLRCRPDAAPGSPAQAGTAATLSRALRLLEESGDASGLADRLGVTDRHLRRLFARHLGATPAEVLRTRRLHLARQLLETSSLRIIDVAHAAGFHSLRRFNEAVRRGFGRTPSQLRTQPLEAGAELSLRLPFHPPLDFEALCAFYAARALPGLEEVRGAVWRRRLPEGWLEVRRDGPAHLQARTCSASSICARTRGPSSSICRAIRR
jgi:AraC family transcriptional regulator of adaptative response / DNA-3-methyladenine glycosylase II